ncbi:MAG: transcription antitermination factor NusB [Bacteroidota bacterium]
MSASPPLSKRRQVRERVLQAVYAHQQSGDDVHHILKEIVRPTFEGEKTYLRFAEKLFVRSVDVRHEADVLTERHVQNWDLSRLALTDRLVLRLAIAEFLYFEDIPPKVTINEYVEVARAFGTDKSDAFVNGVLDAVLRDLRNADRLKKSGRGLVNTSSN